MTEVSEVASTESMRAVPALREVRWYMLRRQEERAPLTDAACLVGGCGVPHRLVRRASSRGEVLEVSSDAKGVEREALIIRHTVCSSSLPGKEAGEEPPCLNRILPQNQNSRNFNP